MKKITMTILCTDKYFEYRKDYYENELQSCKDLNDDEHEKSIGLIKTECFVEDVTE